MEMNKILSILLLLLSSVMATSDEEKLIREYSPPDKLDVLVENYSPDSTYLLVQLNLKNDSLITRLMNAIPLIQINHGPASYQRMMNIHTFEQLESTISASYFEVIDYNYKFDQIIEHIG